MTHEQELRETRKLVHTAADKCQDLSTLDLVFKLLLLSEQEEQPRPQMIRGGGVIRTPGTGWHMAAR